MVPMTILEITNEPILATFDFTIIIFYKSKTELLFVYTMSFNFNTNAIVKYKPNDKPNVKKVT